MRLRNRRTPAQLTFSRRGEGFSFIWLAVLGVRNLSAARVAIRYLTAGALKDVSKLRYQAVFLMGAGGSGKGYVGRRWMKYMPGAPSTGLDYEDPRHKEMLKRKLTDVERGQSNLSFERAVGALKRKGIFIEIIPGGKAKIPFNLYQYGPKGDAVLIAPAKWPTLLPPKIYEQVAGLRDLVFSAPVHEIPSYWRQVNPDLYKKELAGYLDEAPGYVHEMSSDMAKSYFEAVLETGDPLFVDGTGSNQGKLQIQLQTAKDAGYRTSLVFVFVPLTVNQIRNATRDRMIPAFEISRQWPKISSNFVALRDIADKSKVILNEAKSLDEAAYLAHREHVEQHIRKTSHYASLYDLIAEESPSELSDWGPLLSTSSDG